LESFIWVVLGCFFSIFHIFVIGSYNNPVFHPIFLLVLYFLGECNNL
jgi:hypothetical protein